MVKYQKWQILTEWNTRSAKKESPTISSKLKCSYTGFNTVWLVRKLPPCDVLAGQPTWARVETELRCRNQKGQERHFNSHWRKWRNDYGLFGIASNYITMHLSAFKLCFKPKGYHKWIQTRNLLDADCTRAESTTIPGPMHVINFLCICQLLLSHLSLLPPCRTKCMQQR